MFRIGQKVVALVTYRGIAKGNIYTVLSVEYCPKCGKQIVSVGLVEDNLKIGYGCDCGLFFPLGSEKKYYSSRFAPVEEISETKIEEVLQSISDGVKC